ncbi:TPA: hypothetical protein ACH5NL_000472, partial [Campylobacter coli]
MTAYLHIGTPKTGTSSIQTFMVKNDENLLKKEFVYSRSIRVGGQHWDLATLTNVHCLEVKNERQKLFYQEKMEKLKQEVQVNKDKIFIFSSEGLTWSLNLAQIEPVKALNDLLCNLGFNDIKIILYLRNQADLMVSMGSQDIKSFTNSDITSTLPSQCHITSNVFDFKNIIQKYAEVFGKENLIVKLFDKNEFRDGDLLKDFIDAIGLEWDDNFIIPDNQNETLDLIGFKLGKRINSHLKNRHERDLHGMTWPFYSLYFCSKDKALKFMPKKEHYQIWNDYFEETNEWVRKEFFPHKERLFPKKDLTNYKENYELKEMKPEYWDKIAEFIADFAKNRKKIIDDKDKLIAQKDQQLQEKDQVIQAKTQELNSLPIKKQQLEISNLEQDLINKKLQTKQLERQLGLVSNDAVVSNGDKITIIHPNSAKSRIQNQLSYKLGQAMIVNSKSMLGYIRMPFVLSYIYDKHKQEQKIYQENIKKDPSLKLPPLESYPDYKEALKEKECLTYKLG